MELKDFIKETLEQIVEGVRSAQATEAGKLVNAPIEGGSSTKDLGGNLINRGRYGVYTRVDFDVSVAAETSGRGGLKVAVFGQGIDAGADRKSTSANRLSFSVPLLLPDGDATKSKEANAAAAARPRRKVASQSWLDK